MSHAYLVALPIDDLPLGATYPKGESLPLHCTVMSWFHPGQQLRRQHLEGELALLAFSAVGGITLVAECFERFGPEREVSAYVLRADEGLQVLHTRLLVFLAIMGSVPTELRWVGAGFRPHVSDYAGKSFGMGSRHRAMNIVLVERHEDTRIKKVIKVFPFNNVTA